MEKYRSATIALNTTISEFPNTNFKEEILFLILKSNYLYASNSVESKKLKDLKKLLNLIILLWILIKTVSLHENLKAFTYRA